MRSRHWLGSLAAWRAWNVARALGIVLVVVADLWLRSSEQAPTDVRLEILAALLILLVFAGRWRREAFEKEPRGPGPVPRIALGRRRAEARPAEVPVERDAARN